MHHFVTEMCTHMNISVTKRCIVGYGTGALWGFCNPSIGLTNVCPWYVIARYWKDVVYWNSTLHADRWRPDVARTNGIIGLDTDLLCLGILNSSLHGQNDRHFADDIFKCIFMNENICTSIQFSLKSVPKHPTINKTALVQVMAWRRSGDKPLLEPIPIQFTDSYMQH